MPHAWVWVLLFLGAFLSALYLGFVYVQDQAEGEAIVDLQQMSEALFRSHIQCWLEGQTLDAYLNSSPLRQLTLGCDVADRPKIQRFLLGEGWQSQNWMRGCSVEHGKVDIRYYDPTDPYYSLCVPPQLRSYLGVPVFVPKEPQKAATFRRDSSLAEARAVLGSVFKGLLLS